MTSNDLQLNMGNGRLAGRLPAHPRRGLCRCYEADEARLDFPSLYFVQTLQSKETTKWTRHPPLRFLRTLFTALWN
jgi:hypothetical protein